MTEKELKVQTDKSIQKIIRRIVIQTLQTK